MFVYLARPIDQAGESSWLNTMTIELRTQLKLAGIGAYLPSAAYQASASDPEHAAFIDDSNMDAQYRADAFIAILPAHVPTLGTPVEIERSIWSNTPTLIFTDIRGSVQLAAWEKAGATVFDLNGISPLPNTDELRAILQRRPNPTEGSEPEAAAPALMVKADPGAYLPNRAHKTDAGLDIATSETWTLHSGCRELIPTGIYAPPPEGWYGRITGRSSALSKLNVQIHEGIIDAGYTGELMIGATYQGVGSTRIAAGTRLAQYILCSTWNGEIEVVDELPVTARGERGWGSTGS